MRCGTCVCATWVLLLLPCHRLFATFLSPLSSASTLTLGSIFKGGPSLCERGINAEMRPKPSVRAFSNNLLDYVLVNHEVMVNSKTCHCSSLAGPASLMATAVTSLRNNSRNRFTTSWGPLSFMYYSHMRAAPDMANV